MADALLVSTIAIDKKSIIFYFRKFWFCPNMYAVVVVVVEIRSTEKRLCVGCF